MFVDRAADPPVEFGGGVTELSVTENCQGRSVKIRLAPFAVEMLLNIAHIRRVD
jgi:hypothetical protein